VELTCPEPAFDIDPDYLLVDFVGFQPSVASGDTTIVWRAALRVPVEAGVGEGDLDLMEADWPDGFVVAVAGFVSLDVVGSRVDPAEELDECDADIAVYAVLFDGRDLHPYLVEFGIETSGTSFLALDEIHVHPAWRGRKLGPWLLCRVMQALTTDQTLVATHSVAYEFDDDDVERVEASLRIETMLSRIGFVRYSHGLLLFDPATTNLHKAIDELQPIAGRLP
jgi:GNAT superfamily N-acetyltransferase